MTDTVDLIVVGVEGDIPRAELSEKLVTKFNQGAYTFEALLDGAYGESGPYAAQSDVPEAQAEEGKVQLEELGLVCMVVPTGEIPEIEAPAPIVVQTDESLNADVTNADGASIDAEIHEANSALATFKAESDTDDASPESDASDVSFDVDDVSSADGALAGFKKSTKTDASGEVDFSDDIESVGVEGGLSEGGLASAKNAKNNVSDVDDALDHDFSEQLDDVGADESAAGLKEAQQAKPDFDADVAEVDFSDDVGSIGIREEDPAMTAVAKSKLVEEEAERNLNSFPKEQDSDANMDFSDELEVLSTGGSSVAEEAEDPAEDISVDLDDAVDVADAPEIADAADKANVAAKTDVPEALTGNSTADELEAELIDPAPAEKKEKAPVEIDDGGLSLSNDDDAPLTAPKEKSNVQADDGGLSLSTDDAAPLTAPKAKANPDAADDGGLSLDTADSDENTSAPVTAPAAAPAAAAVAAAAATVGAVAAGSDTEAPDTTPVSESATPADSTSAKIEPVANTSAAESVSAESAVVPEELATPVQTESVVQPLSEPAANQGSAEVAATPSDDAVANVENESNEGVAAVGGLVLPGQLGSSVVPQFTSEKDLDDAPISAATAPLRDALPTPPTTQSLDSVPEDDQPADVEDDSAAKKSAAAAKKKNKKTSNKSSKKKLAAAVAGIAVLVGGGTFAFMNAGSISSLPGVGESEEMKFSAANSTSRPVDKIKVQVAEMQPGADLENLSTGELLGNLSGNNNSSGILDLEPYFLESGDLVRRGPRIGAAIPAESGLMARNRVPHPADKYFDDWSNRESDLALFLALLDNLIEKGDLKVAQQLSDRAKDKLFSVMSTQRLARAYSDAGENAKVSRLMSMAARGTYAIKAPEERVLALSDYGFTEQSIGLNEDANDTFLKTSILARNLAKPETRAVGLSSAAIYFKHSGREKQAEEMLEQSMQASQELPQNTAAKDLAIRYIALTTARMGLFSQALNHTKLIVDPIATVSAYHGIALAIESTGDNTNARKVLNMAYRAGSLIDDEDERSKLLSKVILASESE